MAAAAAEEPEEEEVEEEEEAIATTKKKSSTPSVRLEPPYNHKQVFTKIQPLLAQFLVWCESIVAANYQAPTIAIEDEHQDQIVLQQAAFAEILQRMHDALQQYLVQQRMAYVTEYSMLSIPRATPMSVAQCALCGAAKIEDKKTKTFTFYKSEKERKAGVKHAFCTEKTANDPTNLCSIRVQSLHSLYWFREYAESMLQTALKTQPMVQPTSMSWDDHWIALLGATCGTRVKDPATGHRRYTLDFQKWPKKIAADKKNMLPSTIGILMGIFVDYYVLITQKLHIIDEQELLQ
jgi:hypothetical protein